MRRATITKKAWLLVGIAIVCGAAPNLAPAGADIGPTDPCASQSADTVLWVPSAFNVNTKLKSGSGSYAYGTRGCSYFIADVAMATYSHSSGAVVAWTDAYDLPSSSSFGGTIPTTMEDCNRFTVQTLIYRKLHTETSFKFQRSSSYQGAWSSLGCTQVLKSATAGDITLVPSTSGWDIYRFAVKVKLRSTYQEAGVWFGDPPLPDPK